jgi:hypothetical protein
MGNEKKKQRIRNWVAPAGPPHLTEKEGELRGKDFSGRCFLRAGTLRRDDELASRQEIKGILKVKGGKKNMVR